MRLFVARDVSLRIIRRLDVDASRNKIDSNFLEATDAYVEALCVFGGQERHVHCGNLGLAKRAAAAVSTVDVHALAMVIAKDRCSGAEQLRLTTDDDTLTLAVALVLKREQHVARLGRLAECQVFRGWDFGLFVKTSRWADVPLLVAGACCPLTLLPGLFARWLLFQPDSGSSRYLRQFYT